MYINLVSFLASTSSRRFISEYVIHRLANSIQNNHRFEELTKTVLLLAITIPPNHHINFRFSLCDSHKRLTSMKKTRLCAVLINVFFGKYFKTLGFICQCHFDRQCDISII